MWSLDTVVQMQLAAPNGVHDILVVVDTFTKWVEIGTVTHLDLTHITHCFHANTVCWYGLPRIVCTDGSAEYKSEFWAYLREAGSTTE